VAVPLPRFYLGAAAGLAGAWRVRAGIGAQALPRGALAASDGAEDAAYLIGHIADRGLPRGRSTTSWCSRRGR